MKGHCKDCKWWVRGSESDWHSDYNHCTHDKVGAGDPEADGLLEYEADPMRGFVATGPDFGCCHFEQKVESTQT